MIFLLFFAMSYSVSGKETTRTDLERNSDGKVLLYWKQIAPYIVMQKTCESEKIIFLFSEIENLALVSDFTVISPKEVIATNKIQIGSASQIILRYTFCIDNSLKTFAIQNNLYESYPIDLEQENFHSLNNLGFTLDQNNDFLTAKAKEIEKSETWRSLLLEEMYASAQKPVTKFNNPEQPKEIEPTINSPKNINDEIVLVEQSEVEPTINFSQSYNNEIVIAEQSEIEPVLISNQNSYRETDNTNFFIKTSASFDLDNVNLNGYGNGYKIQIIAKKRNDHTAQSIQYYYGIPYAVEEHYDGVWHRFTLENYISSWENAYSLLKIIRDGYGITDAFISLYQNNERIGIYPCQKENSFNNSMEFAEYLSELENE